MSKSKQKKKTASPTTGKEKSGTKKKLKFSLEQLTEIEHLSNYRDIHTRENRRRELTSGSSTTSPPSGTDEALKISRSWASSLTNEALADRIDSMIAQPRGWKTHDKRALLEEARARLLYFAVVETGLQSLVRQLKYEDNS